MRLTAILLVGAALQVSAKGFSQKITINERNVSMKQIFVAIEKQTEYTFIYNDQLIEKTGKIDINVKNETVQDVLEYCFRGQALTYTMIDNMIVIKKKEVQKAVDFFGESPVDIKGKVTNDKGDPVPGATIRIKESGVTTVADNDGNFHIITMASKATFIISSVGHETQEIKYTGKSFLSIVLKQIISELDQSIVIAYGTTTRRFATGDVGRITSKDIESQPVSDPLMTLEGRIPGLVVTQNNGVPGSSLNVQIRGLSSLLQGSSPLFIVDGVPFSANNALANQVSSAAGGGIGAVNPGGLSPFNSINPSDIESIEVLKDADATAIYGSRGANGVVLITTKKARAGKLLFSGSIHSGASVITRFMSMMNTQQYVMMRNEAFRNDRVTPTNSTAPDLLLWDTTRYTDIKKLLIGGTAHATDAEGSVSGGTGNTTFFLGAGYHHQTTVYPGDMADNRGSLHLNINQLSTNHKFSANLSAIYSADKNNLVKSDLAYFFSLPPDLPPLYDSLGHLNWAQKGGTFTNPLANAKMPYSAETDNLLSNLLLNYHVLPGLSIKTSLGYNSYYINETALNPISAQNPASNPTGSAIFANSQLKSWIIEPQAEYVETVLKGKLDILVGGTWQEQSSYQTRVNANGYTSDNLLQSIAGAGSITAGNSNSEYHYQALFGRLNYMLENKYILNFTARRDGSSRFGPGKQFGNFGSVGGAWIFSEEQYIKKHLSFISFGKLRGSYGTTGNDQIGDYQYLDSWTNSPLPYAGSSALTPARLFNMDYSWEVNKKLEAAVELGFLKERILTSAAWYRNRSGNQLVNYTLSAQTGGSTIIKNFPAVVENTGFEFTLTAKNIVSRNFNWTSLFNISTPRNRLISFPGLSSSSYNGRFYEGQSLSVVSGFHLLGVDPATGVFVFATKAGTSSSPASSDFRIIGDMAPQYYGGFQNSFSYKGWQFDLFLEFKKQIGINYKSIIKTNIPGMQANQPEVFLRRWQKAGDISDMQQYTANYSNPAALTALSYSGSSDANYSDASYVRIKNVSISYAFPQVFVKRAGFQSAKLFVLGQNLFTITNYWGNDPETMNFYSMPPLKTITAGIQFTF